MTITVPFVHSAQEFRELILIVARKQGLPESLVEKDYWVTHALWALRELGLDVWFKGGTSLSKGFGIIQRFSEDLDLKLDGAALPQVRDWTATDKKTKIRERAEFFEALERIIEIPDTIVTRMELERKFRYLKLKVEYPIIHETPGPVRPFVQLGIGSTRVTPYTALDLSSWVHDYLEEQGDLPDFVDNRPIGVSCLRPEVTLLEKLDAISGRFGEREPAEYIRHYSDAKQIINWLPTNGIGPEELGGLAREMLGEGVVKRACFEMDNPAYSPTEDELWGNIREAHEELGILYWAERPTLDDACSAIRACIEMAGLSRLS